MRNTRRPRSPKIKRLQEFALYIAISTAIMGIQVGGAIVAGGNGYSILKWLNLVIFTVFNYGFWLADEKANLKSKSFWTFTRTAFLVHTVSFAMMLIN